MRASQVLFCLAVVALFVSSASAVTVRAPPVNVPLKKHWLPASSRHPFFFAGNAKWRQPVAQGTGSTVNFPVGGNIFPIGIYYTEVQIGTPARTFKVAIDTGSADLIVPQVGCNGCHANSTNEFDPSQSSTANKISCYGRLQCPNCAQDQCAFSNTYQTCDLSDPTAPCTISGPIYSDTFAMGSLTAPNVVLGAITFQTKNFQQFYVVDGVMGMIGSKGSWDETIAFQALYDNKQFSQNTFAMCLIDQGGVLTYGGYDSQYISGSIMWAPMAGFGYYSNQFNSVTIGTQVQAPVQNQIIIDSGTNVLLLEDAMFDFIKDTIKAQCSSSSLHGVCDVPSGSKDLFSGGCFTFTEAQKAAFPNITLNLQGANLTLSGDDYLVDHPTKSETCYGISNTGSTFNIIGDAVMQNYYVIFDRDNSRLGWAPVNKEACLGNSKQRISKDDIVRTVTTPSRK
eukprot:TRINITY_DN12634_c0_g1_i1.p1 TRINITY_DN12634_c0_g1~~TRINITY_DN12634_c0_g1_i1.p1  ORF type:complete len:454 (+),score=114.32 TRINITY_DN12634_c0_g1_i1:59-1420(+)